MTNIKITYNPYTVETQILINKKAIGTNSRLWEIREKRLQEWIEKKDSWEGIFPMLRQETGSSNVHIDFYGTTGDFDDLCYAKDRSKDVFDTIELVHANKEDADNTDPYQKLVRLKALYEEMLEGPIEEFKTDDIRQNFENALNSDFRIVVVAPMSSGKSTLINSLLGHNLLPAVNQATTAVITEIRDNDNMEGFIVSATDKNGKTVVSNEKATPKLIEELNYKKDPDDPEGKEAFISTINIEGPVPNIPSDLLSTVFIDTPGGNNSQNDEHEALMNSAISDENKSLILYVFNGAQLGTNDSNIILERIARAMEDSDKGKQSRDRFIFVANRMDDYDPSKEPYEEVVKKTILPMLAKHGIFEPNLYLVTAQTAKLIRMSKNGEELTEKEEDDLFSLIRRFNKRDDYILPAYSSLKSRDKKTLIDKVKEYKEKAANATASESEALKRDVAEICSGVPALELAIKEYLEKYALAIKIKAIHDTFMRKVSERKMVDGCKEKWASSTEALEKVKAEIKVKEAKYSSEIKQTKENFKKQIDSIRFDDRIRFTAQKSIIDQIDALVEKQRDTIEKDKAEAILTTFSERLSKILGDAQKKYDFEIENNAMKVCRELISKFNNFVSSLENSGFLKIDGFDIKKTCNFSNISIGSIDALLKDKNYNYTEAVKTGTKEVKKSGFFNAIKRFFGASSGWETVAIYEDRDFIKIKDLIRDSVTSLQHEVDKELEKGSKKASDEIERIKKRAKNSIDQIDKMVTDTLEQIRILVENQEKIRQECEENKKNTEWIESFILKVDELLKI